MRPPPASGVSARAPLGPVSMTPDQNKASDPGRNAFVAASAGTGKTHVLVTRIIRLLVLGASPSELICLTFTKAAAAEMKTRLYARLGQWTRLSDQDLKDHLWRDYALNTDQDMLIRARQLFAETLDLAENLRIQTFHSFCQSLLGRFPLEAGLVPGFRAAEDAEARAAMRLGRDEALYKSLAEPGFRDQLSLLAERTTEADFEDLMLALREKRAMLARGFKSYGGVAAYLAAFQHALGLDGRDRGQILRDAFGHLPFQLDRLRALIPPLEAGKATDKKAAAALAYLALYDPESEPDYAAVRDVFLVKGGGVRVTLFTKNMAQEHPDIETVLPALAAWCQALDQHLMRLTLFDQSKALIMIGALQIDAYEGVKRQKGLVDFSDMVDRTVALVRDADITQWILYKLDQEVGHILVDEAQDTNARQWQVVDALAEEFFAGEGSQSGPVDDQARLPRTVFAVGDEKQSIFSFQEADPDEFVAARRHLTKKAQDAGALAETVPMTLSFRSGKAVLDLVDRVFDQDDRASLGVLFDDQALHHQTARKGVGGRVELWPLMSADQAGDEDPWSLPLVQESAGTASEKLAARVSGHIKALIQSGACLEATGQPIRPGDIMILVRRRNEFTDQLSRFLQLQDIPVAGRDRMILTAELPVMDLMALARSALLPEDDLTLATVLKGPFLDLSEEDLFALCHDRGSHTLYSRFASAKQPHIMAAHTRYLALIRDAERVDCAPYFYRILEELGGRAQLKARLGSTSDEPVNAFLEQAEAFDSGQVGGLLSFLHHVEEAGAEVKRDLENTTHAVRIMTAHSAKGLQAPIVYLPDTTGVPDTSKDCRLLPWQPSPDAAPFLIWTSDITGLPDVDQVKHIRKESLIAEYRRLLYVALTRAEDRLYIAGHEGKNALKDDCWYRSIERGFDRLQKAEEQPDGSRIYHVPQTADVTPREQREDHKETVAVPSWLNRRPQQASEPRPLRATERVTADPFNGPTNLIDRLEADSRSDQTISPLERGSLIHRMLEWLPNLSADDRQAKVMAYLGRRLPKADAQAQTDRLLALIARPDLSLLFSDLGKSEVTLTGLIGETDISIRIDRLVVSDTEIVFADYKTGDRAVEQVADIPRSSLVQMALYHGILREIFPDKPIKALLIYTASTTVLSLPETLLKTVLQAWQEGSTK